MIDNFQVDSSLHNLRLNDPKCLRRTSSGLEVLRRDVL